MNLRRWVSTKHKHGGELSVVASLENSRVIWAVYAPLPFLSRSSTNSGGQKEKENGSKATWTWLGSLLHSTFFEDYTLILTNYPVLSLLESRATLLAPSPTSTSSSSSSTATPVLNPLRKLLEFRRKAAKLW